MTDPMTQQRLDEIRARCDKATRGPWIYDKRVGCVAVYHGEKACCIDETEGRRLFYADGFLEKEADGYTRWKTNPADCTNAAFIAHARQDIPALLAEVERLRAEVERFRAKRNETIDAIENLMESCRACDMCALNESDDTCSDNGEGYCSPVWIGRKEG